MNPSTPNIDTTGMFHPDETVVWDYNTKSFTMPGPACVCFMLHLAFAPDHKVPSAKLRQRRAAVWAGVALAAEQGFADEPRLLQMLQAGAPDMAALRALTDQMLAHITPDEFLHAMNSLLAAPQPMHSESIA